MPSTHPSTSIWLEMSEMVGCDIATIKAVFEVEAAGRFFESSGKLPRRFEPHHFPRDHWNALDFAVPQGTAPWRASLRLSTSARRRMFDIAESIDPEAAYDATSWGAPQIMGFNAELAGYQSSVEMVDAFEQSADEQIRAFVHFCDSAGLSTHLRSQDWLAFASGYNGSGQAPVYAARIETAYRRQSGGSASASVLRLGMSGKAVEELQERLVHFGHEITVDGYYGNETLNAVRAFQQRRGLSVDGVAGAVTQRELVSMGTANLERDREEVPETSRDQLVDKVIQQGSTLIGSGGAVGLLAGINENAQTILVGGAVVGAFILAVIWLLKRKG